MNHSSGASNGGVGVASVPVQVLLPREHGAWSMLALPFLSAAFLLRPPASRLIPAFVLVLVVFLLREPLIILARQRWVWRDEHAETGLARKAVWALGVVALGQAAWLAREVPREVWPAAIGLGAAAAALMGVSIWLAVRNRQHSALFQAIGSVGLAGSAMGVALASAMPGQRAAVPWAIAILWGAFALHGVAAIPIVHARLAMRRRQIPNLMLAGTGVAATFTAFLAAAAAGGRYGGVATALLFSGIAHLAEWLGLRSPRVPETKLTHLGLRLMSGSILFAVLLTFAVRSLAAVLP